MDSFYIGIDLGGTNIRLAVYNERTNSIAYKIKRPVKYYMTAQEEAEKKYAMNNPPVFQLSESMR